MLKDYNLTKALYKMLQNDEELTKKMNVNIYSGSSDNASSMPHILINLNDSKLAQWSSKFQRIVADFSLEILSNYHGTKEIQAIAQRLIRILEAQPLYAEYEIDADEEDSNADRDKTINVRSSVNVIESNFKKLKQGQKGEIKIKTMMTITPNNEPLDPIDDIDEGTDI